MNSTCSVTCYNETELGVLTSSKNCTPPQHGGAACPEDEETYKEFNCIDAVDVCPSKEKRALSYELMKP